MKKLGIIAAVLFVLSLAVVFSQNSNNYSSVGSASQVVALFTGCSGTQYLGADGACHAAAAAGQGYSAVTFSATPTFDATGGVQTFKITLTGDVTSSTFSNGVAGSFYTFVVCQDSTGNRAFAVPSQMHQYTNWMASPSNCVTQTFAYDGTNLNAINPWTPETRAFTANAMDDEFDGNTLSNLWTWTNQGTSTAVPSQGVLAIKPQQGGAGTFAQRLLCQATPTAPYTFVAQFQFEPYFTGTTGFILGGIGLSDGTKSETIGLKYRTTASDNVLENNTWATNASAPTEVKAFYPPQWGPIWLAIQNDNTNNNYMYSFDGVNYATFATEAKAAFLTATKICLFGDVTETNPNITISVKHFRRTQ